jgi:hypothetical protein
MSKIILFLALLFASCNSSGPSSNGKDSANVQNSKDGGSSAWTKEDENEFLAGCIDEAKARYPEDTAFIYCNCVLKQLKKNFPSMDSASVALTDSSRAVAFTKNCK